MNIEHLKNNGIDIAVVVTVVLVQILKIGVPVTL